MSKPRYQIVADQLRRDIKKGRYRVGTFLPTELQLCEMFQISRHTVREALRILMHDRMIMRKQGSGTMVIADARQRFSPSISSVQDLLQYAANTRLSILHTARIRADDEIAELLGCDAGTECVHLHGLRRAQKGAAPFCVSDIYRIADKDPLTKRLLEISDAVYALIEELESEPIGTVEQDISASTLPAAIATELDVAKSSVCLRIARRYFDTSGKLVVAAVNLHPGADFVYSMSLKNTTD